MRNQVTAAVLLFGATAVLLVTAAAEPAAFTLQEHLGHTWTHECVTFPLTPAQQAAAAGGKALVSADGRQVAYQLTPGRGEGESRISFLVDLPPFETRAWRFSDPRVSTTSDLEVRETADELCVTNGVTGLKLRRKLEQGRGPIAAIRLLSGTWTGGSTFALAEKARLTAYELDVKAKGPVFAEIVCRATFADHGYWRLRFRLENDEPAILIEEEFDAPAGGTFSVLLGDAAFKPTHMLHRDSRAESAEVRSSPVGSFFLEPWLHWNNPGRGNWLAVFSPSPPAPAKSLEIALPPPVDKAGAEPEALVAEDKEPAKPKPVQPADRRDDMLMLGLLKPSLWVDPQWKGKAGQVAGSMQTSVRDGVMVADLAVGGGRRAWLLGVLDKRGSEAVLAGRDRRVAPPPQGFIIKHGNIPLDKVKDYVLDWPGDHDNHPCLYLRRQELPALKARLPSNPAELKRWVSDQPIDKYLLDGPIREFIASGDPQLGRRMAEKAEEYLQTCADWYLKEDYLHGPGTAPHMQSLILSTVNLIDAVLSTEAFTPARRKRALAKLAFIGYVLATPDYWSPERGYSGFANMTSVVALYRTAIGCILPSHPQAKEWAAQGLNQLRWQLTAWSDEDGGWVEAPHYAMVSFDHMLAGFSMAANAGLSDDLYAPRMRKVIEWFAAISTPRDKRTGGFRHQPPIGNTYHGEPTGLYGLVAAMWKEKDPEFAAQMQWLYQEHGSFGGLGIGWNFPAMLGYRFMMNASGVTPKPATLGSRWFRNTGLVLRNSMQTDRETYLHMIAGHNHAHYDVDSGSIIIYGKGRVLADDWGYIGMHPGNWHSMLSSPQAGDGGAMVVNAFAAGTSLDYVSGVKGAWQRQIAFIKDNDPLAPNFFLIRDTHSGADAATWRLWLTTRAPGAGNDPAVKLPDVDRDDPGVDLDAPASRKAAAAATPVFVKLHPLGATVIGSDDVDMDIFFHDAGKLALKTETASQRVSCGYRDGKDGPLANTQTVLLATVPGRGAVTALLYPRLRTEAPPKVTWSADGAVAQLETAAGKDWVFVRPKPARVEGDGRTLLPLSDRTEGYGRPMHVRGDVSTPHLLVNNRDTAAGDEKKLRMPSHSITVHPGPVNPVTVVWQSPIAGTVDVDVRVSDADPGTNVTDGWRSDGVLYELRKGADTLGNGAIANGGTDGKLAAERVTVAKGDLLRLVILPGKSEWWDSTSVDMTVREADDRKWDLREALVRGDTLGNDMPGDRSKAVWWVCEGDAPTFDAVALKPPPPEEFVAADPKVRFQGSCGAVRSRGGTVTLSLGAGGTVKAGSKTLTADGPTSRTE